MLNGSQALDRCARETLGSREALIAFSPVALNAQVVAQAVRVTQLALSHIEQRLTGRATPQEKDKLAATMLRLAPRMIAEIRLSTTLPMAGEDPAIEAEVRALLGASEEIIGESRKNRRHDAPPPQALEDDPIDV